MKAEWDKRNGQARLGISVDPVDAHGKWADRHRRETQGTAPNFPMIGDPELKVSKLYGMLPAAACWIDVEACTAADNQTVRNVFIIGPDKKIKTILVYPMTVGRNFHEILRIIDSLQLGAKFRVATPADWKQGGDVIIAGSVSNEEAEKIYPNGWKAPKPYLRIVPQPTIETASGGGAMIFEQVATGGCQSYLVGCPDTLVGAIIDAEASQVDRYRALAAKHGLNIRYVIDTHTHADHFSKYVGARPAGRRRWCDHRRLRGEPGRPHRACASTMVTCIGGGEACGCRRSTHRAIHADLDEPLCWRPGVYSATPC